MAEDFLSIEIVGERELLRNLDFMPDIVREILVSKLESLTKKLSDKVVSNIEDRLNKKGDGEKNGRKLRDSVEWEVINSGSGPVEGRVFIQDIPYARIQEDGGTTPPHVILPRNAKLLAFYAATGDKVLATRVNHPGGKIPATHYMKDAYRSMGPEISRSIKNAVVQGIRQNMRKG